MAIKIIQHLSNHYELDCPKVTFKGKRRHICYWAKPHLSFIRDQLTRGVVVHEFAHYLENIRNGNRKHNPQLLSRIVEIWRFIDPEFRIEQLSPMQQELTGYRGNL